MSSKILILPGVALRKESVDRNWMNTKKKNPTIVALRKESVDRNIFVCYTIDNERRSLSARRAWIEIGSIAAILDFFPSLSARRAWIEMVKSSYQLQP